MTRKKKAPVPNLSSMRMALGSMGKAGRLKFGPSKGRGPKAGRPKAAGQSRSVSGNARQKPLVSSRGPLHQVFYGAAVGLVWLTIGLGLSAAWLARDLPDLETLPPPGINDRVEVQADDGTLLATYGAVYGDWLDFEQIPSVMIEALVAIEDRRFFDHGAIDPRGILRAMLSNLRSGGFRQGGSSLTQQLAKNLFLGRERTITRKVKELLLAIWLEGELDKADILTIYLNRVYFGAGTYGLDAAARTYFGHSARRLSLGEAALLAGLLKAPSALAPTSHPEKAKARMKVVLGAMRRQEMITAPAAEAAGRSLPRLDAGSRGGGTRYFSDWVMARARSLVSEERQPLVIVTSLDPALQKAAERAVEAGLDGEGKKRSASQAALVALSTDGAVKAMVGGRSFKASQFNRAVLARRQPGSAFKLFVYLAALEAGHRPDDQMLDGPITIDGWSPGNFDGKFKGEISIREAFVKSVNTVAVRLTESVGRERVAATARRLGLGGITRTPASLALGTIEVSPLELTAAYAALANGGNLVTPFAILEIRSAVGELMYRRPSSPGPQVLKASSVALMSGLLQDVVARGTGRAAAIGRPAGGKTGTSQDFRDAWFLGFTSDYVAGVWVGNDDGRPMQGVTGGGLPARIWAAFMRDAHKGVPVRPLLAETALGSPAEPRN